METGGLESGLPGASQGARPSNKRLQQTQAQVDEVVGIMKVSLFFSLWRTVRKFVAKITYCKINEFSIRAL